MCLQYIFGLHMILATARSSIAIVRATGMCRHVCMAGSYHAHAAVRALSRLTHVE